jgi:hypothetical protein
VVLEDNLIPDFLLFEVLWFFPFLFAVEEEEVVMEIF